jgi:hypothetical protein
MGYWERNQVLRARPGLPIHIHAERTVGLERATEGKIGWLGAART